MSKKKKIVGDGGAKYAATPLAFHLVPCHGGCGGDRPILAPICAGCLAALPADVAARVEQAWDGYNIVERFAAEDAARAHLRFHPRTDVVVREEVGAGV